MKAYLLLFLDFLRLTILFLRPDGYRAIVVENLLLKRQLIVHSRTHKRVSKLSVLDPALFGFWTAFLNPRRVTRSAILIKPSTLLKFHSALVKKKYHTKWLASARTSVSETAHFGAIFLATLLSRIVSSTGTCLNYEFVRDTL